MKTRRLNPLTDLILIESPNQRPKPSQLVSWLSSLSVRGATDQCRITGRREAFAINCNQTCFFFFNTISKSLRALSLSSSPFSNTSDLPSRTFLDAVSFQDNSPN